MARASAYGFTRKGASDSEIVDCARRLCLEQMELAMTAYGSGVSFDDWMRTRHNHKTETMRIAMHDLREIGRFDVPGTEQLLYVFLERSDARCFTLTWENAQSLFLCGYVEIPVFQVSVDDLN